MCFWCVAKIKTAGLLCSGGLGLGLGLGLAASTKCAVMCLYVPLCVAMRLYVSPGCWLYFPSEGRSFTEGISLESIISQPFVCFLVEV